MTRLGWCRVKFYTRCHTRPSKRNFIQESLKGDTCDINRVIVFFCVSLDPNNARTIYWDLHFAEYPVCVYAGFWNLNHSFTTMIIIKPQCIFPFAILVNSFSQSARITKPLACYQWCIGSIWSLISQSHVTFFL